ncbi:MAG TPA: ABC transporter permease [Vicinamibacterales bacterium]|nr:ABC transporter permease [Vicinamibacterales bacterium]
MDTFLQDLRFGLRQLRRTPGFTIAALIALALGVGSTTAIFTVLDRVVLRPLPYPEPDRLAMVWDTSAAKGLAHERISPVTFHDYRNLTQVFADGAGWWYPQVNIAEPGTDPLRVNTVEASGNFFSVIGVQPLFGDGFPPSTFYSPDRIAVISHRLWRERFNADPSIIGKPLALSSIVYQVVGVMPPGFNYPNNTDVWQRLQWDFAQHSRGAHFVESLFRLQPGVSVERASAELRALTNRLGVEYKATNADWSARAVPLAHEIEGYFRPALFALFGAAAFLLVITCTNVASLLLARATVREREVAVRAAIGASRSRLVQQFLTESVLLATIGTMLGVGVALLFVRALVAATPVELPRLASVGIDARVLLFAVALAMLTALAFGVVPAMLMARGDMQRPLKESGRSESGGARSRTRSVLVVAEIGLAVMLLVGAALLGRSFQRLVQEDPGFQSARVLTVNVDLPASYRDFKKIADFYDQLLTSLRGQPGVADAGLANFLPLDAAWRLRFAIDGRPQPAPQDAPLAQHQSVDEDYFKVIGVPLVKGRFFEARDTVDAPGVVIINESLARREWPNQDPIGQRIMTSVRYIGPMGAVLKPPTAKYEIVGVVRDVKNASLSQPPEPAVYFTYRQFSFRGFNLVVKGQGGAAALTAAVRASVQRLDTNLPLSSARMLDRVVGDATDRPRALMLLMGVFAALALGLSALGIYSVLSYSVNQRRQELSVRMALGAEPRDVLWLVVRQGLWLAAIGGAAGAAGALALGRTLSTLLYGVSASDSAAFGVALALALVTALVACLLPARRAATLDPLAGLRAE